MYLVGSCLSRVLYGEPLQDSRDTLRVPWKYVRTSRHAARPIHVRVFAPPWPGSLSKTACPACSWRGPSRML